MHEMFDETDDTIQEPPAKAVRTVSINNDMLRVKFISDVHLGLVVICF